MDISKRSRDDSISLRHHAACRDAAIWKTIDEGASIAIFFAIFITRRLAPVARKGEARVRVLESAINKIVSTHFESSKFGSIHQIRLPSDLALD